MMNETDMKQCENKNALNIEKEIRQSADNNRTIAQDNESLGKILSFNGSESINPSSPNHKEPRCVVNKNEENENSTRKRKKSDGELIMMSYNRRSANELCTRLLTELRKLRYHVWMDEDDVSST
jgi:hypothetical protein